MLAHLGIAVFILGVTLVKTGEVERDVRMQVGRHRRRSATYASPSAACATCAGPNYRAARATVEVTRQGPAGRHPASGEAPLSARSSRPMTEADIDVGLTRDLYVSLGEPVDGGAWIVRVLRQALRRLDLGRLPGDGARRPARRQRPALSRRRVASARPKPTTSVASAA